MFHAQKVTAGLVAEGSRTSMSLSSVGPFFVWSEFGQASPKLFEENSYVLKSCLCACCCIVVLRRRAFKVARIGDLKLKMWNTSFPNIGEGAGSNYPTFLREVISNNIGEGGSFFVCLSSSGRPTAVDHCTQTSPTNSIRLTRISSFVVFFFTLGAPSIP